LIGGLLGGKKNPNPHLPPYTQEDLYDTLYLINRRTEDYEYYRKEDALPPKCLIPSDEILSNVVSINVGRLLSEELPEASIKVKYLPMIEKWLACIEKSAISSRNNHNFIKQLYIVANEPIGEFSFPEMERLLIKLVCRRLRHDFLLHGSATITYTMLLNALLRNSDFNVDSWME